MTDQGSVPIQLGAAATNPAGLQAIPLDITPNPPFAPVVAEAVTVPGCRSSINPSQWIRAVAGVGISVFGLFWNATPVYLATDSHVYVSYSSGTMWDDMSNGLPRRPHCSGLRLEGEMLYLSTFGRSLWMLHTPPSPPPDYRGSGSDFGGGDFGNDSGGNRGNNDFPHRHHPPLAE